MLTYTPKQPHFSEAKHEYPWLLTLLVFAWLWPGIFSHDLWNPHEPALYTAIKESPFPFFPTLFGQPYFDAPPIYIWLASSLRAALSPWAMDAYSASRFATVFFMAVGLLANGMAGYRFLGASHGRSTVLILIGSLGLLTVGHFLDGQSVAFAGIGLCLWGFSVTQKQAVFAAWLLGIGILLLNQSMGCIISGSILLIALLLSLTTQWRSVRYFAVLLGALVIVLPIMALHMIILAKFHPSAWQTYWQFHLLGAYGGLANVSAQWQPVYFLKNMLWFALPAYPLAGWTLYRCVQRGETTRWMVLCVACLCIFSALLMIYPTHQLNDLVILLPPLAILGAAKLDDLRRGVAAFLNWFGIMVFGMTAVFLWLGFVAMNYGFPAKLAERAAYFSPFYTREIDAMPIVVATLFTPAWIFAITRKRIRGRQAVSNWASGVTLAWALLLTLFLPWLDAAKSYRPIVQQMESKLPETSCVYIAPEYTSARLAWQEYSKLAIRSDDARACGYELIQYHPKDAARLDAARVIWQGKRPRQKSEAFALLALPK